MLRKIEIAVLSVLACFALVSARQTQMLKIVPDIASLGVKAGGDVITVQWIELERVGAQTAKPDPAEARVYFSRTPAAGNLAAYQQVRNMVVDNTTSPLAPGSSVRKRTISFVPNSQSGAMGPGMYYGIVASVSGGDTLFSDYFNIMVESATPAAIIQPTGRVSGLTPIFRWMEVSGVPYYHLILTDRPLLNSSGTGLSDSVSILWQAITPNTQIAYGSPDPSGTITASPPPLSPEVTYFWMVLNNYGNHMAFSSSVINAMDLLKTGRFIITGDTLASPRATAPLNGVNFNYQSNPQVTLRWTNLDTLAGSYLINVFSTADEAQLGMGALGEFSASVLVWERSVLRGSKRPRDTLSVTLDAANTLTGGEYTWRVYAINSKGEASTGAHSARTFRYAANAGAVLVRTAEPLGGIDPHPAVGFVELRTEVISGPMQAPLAFYTAPNGVSDRAFPVGRYRITASKEGYNTQSVTVNVNQNQTSDVEIIMTRPEAILFGRVFSGVDGSPVNLAKVTAVSEWGDTVATLTNGSGSFTLSCQEADWTVHIEKAGFGYFSPRKVTLRLGDNRDFGSVELRRNPHMLSGAVMNRAGDPIMGAAVRILREGVIVDELASTPANGVFAFYLATGTYTLTVEKPGFTMFSREVIITASQNQNITISGGAALVNGVVLGRSWNPYRNAGVGGFDTAAVVSAKVTFVDTLSKETFTVTSGATFGLFSISLLSNRVFRVRCEASGFVGSDTLFTTVDVGGTPFPPTAASDGTMSFSRTLNGMVMISGLITRDGGGGPLDGVDVQVIDTASGRVIASGRSAVNGRYEVRNIADMAGLMVIAGKPGFVIVSPPYLLNINGGRPAPSMTSYDFQMDEGAKTIEWDVQGYTGNGAVKVVSPFSRTFFFSADSGAALTGAGPGRYLIEASAEDTAILELSYHALTVPDGGDAVVRDIIRFPLTHSSPPSITKDQQGRYILSVDMRETADISKVELFYRNEGSTLFQSDTAGNVAESHDVVFTPRRDGTNLYYYFRVHLSDGRIYGSSKQIFTTYVEPDNKIISRIAVNPAVLANDTLVLPSSYSAQFSFSAFYSALFRPYADNDNYGSIAWSVRSASGGLLGAGTGKAFAYQTGGNAELVTLRAVLSRASGYTMAANAADSVVIPIWVTGAALNSMTVRRNGESGPISSRQSADYGVTARDAAGRVVTIQPRWSVDPPQSGSIGGAGDSAGIFRPQPNFFGDVVIAATVGGLAAEPYTQSVFFALRGGAGSDTVNTYRGMRLAFRENTVSSGNSVEFYMTVPELSNPVIHKGTGEFRMAEDDAAFVLTCAKFRQLNKPVTIIMDVPANMRRAARSRSGEQEFRVGRWVEESPLDWVPLSASGTVTGSDGATVSALLHPVGAGSMARTARTADSGASSAAASKVDSLTQTARYALITKSAKLSVSVAVSPNPFSPYILPVKEHGAGARAGTCIRVNIGTQNAFVKGVRVHVFNATGKRVWAVERLGAPPGEHEFWWNGRTSGSGDGRSAVTEMMWSDGDDMYEQTKNRPLARNGRYFVHVIVTDMDGKQTRAMKPIVLMK